MKSLLIMLFVLIFCCIDFVDANEPESILCDRPWDVSTWHGRMHVAQKVCVDNKTQAILNVGIVCTSKMPPTFFVKGIKDGWVLQNQVFVSDDKLIIDNWKTVDDTTLMSVSQEANLKFMKTIGNELPMIMGWVFDQKYIVAEYTFKGIRESINVILDKCYPDIK